MINHSVATIERSGRRGLGRRCDGEAHFAQLLGGADGEVASRQDHDRSRRLAGRDRDAGDAEILEKRRAGSVLALGARTRGPAGVETVDHLGALAKRSAFRRLRGDEALAHERGGEKHAEMRRVDFLFHRNLVDCAPFVGQEHVPDNPVT
jgi:hypothetical protein